MSYVALKHGSARIVIRTKTSTLKSSRLREKPSKQQNSPTGTNEDVAEARKYSLIDNRQRDYQKGREEELGALTPSVPQERENGLAKKKTRCVTRMQGKGLFRTRRSPAEAEVQIGSRKGRPTAVEPVV